MLIVVGWYRSRFILSSVLSGMSEGVLEWEWDVILKEVSWVQLLIHFPTWNVLGLMILLLRLWYMNKNSRGFAPKENMEVLYSMKQKHL